jgi:hypothetical protein
MIRFENFGLYYIPQPVTGERPPDHWLLRVWHVAHLLSCPFETSQRTLKYCAGRPQFSPRLFLEKIGHYLKRVFRLLNKRKVAAPFKHDELRLWSITLRLAASAALAVAYIHP